MLLALTGVLLFALPAGILGSGFVEVMQQHLQDEELEQSQQISRLTSLVQTLSEQNRSHQRRLQERLTLIEAQLEGHDST